MRHSNVYLNKLPDLSVSPVVCLNTVGCLVDRNLQLLHSDTHTVVRPRSMAPLQYLASQATNSGLIFSGSHTVSYILALVAGAAVVQACISHGLAPLSHIHTQQRLLL